jgi:hypothetical protein
MDIPATPNDKRHTSETNFMDESFWTGESPRLRESPVANDWNCAGPGD